SENMAGKTGQLQLNFATTGDDGYNTLITLNDKSAGWHTATFGTNLAGFKAMDFDWTKINKLRYTWWNLNQSVANMTVKIDNIRFYNAATQEQKTAEVKAVIEAINKIGVLTLDNYKSKESTLVYAEELSDALMAKYGNTILEEVTNAADLVKAREEFTRLTFLSRDEMVADLMADIDAIGKITAQNYLQKDAEIAALEQGVSDLVAQYGQEAKALITNIDKLTAAKQAVEALKQANAVPYGDVDGDGRVSAADALEVLKAVVGNVTLTEEQTVLADVDGDERISAVDALEILKKVVGKIDRFPVEETL
ncbi:MAG: dockerin type I repeat-containing protein, partial [Clostridia bacterium]|nr:dockerin type I repeat-containing protein [Clostridia bacterium]